MGDVATYRINLRGNTSDSGGGGGGSIPSGTNDWDLLTWDGGAWVSAQVLKDVSGTLSVAKESRYLCNNSGSPTVAWNDYYLFSSLAVATLDWDSLFMVDNSVELSLDWANRFMADSSSNQSLDWENRYLIDSGAVTTIDWGFTILNGLEGGQSLDWTNRTLHDTSNIESVNYETRVLIDTSSNTVIDWGQRYLYDSSSNLKLDWENNLIYDSSLQASISWADRQLINSSNDIMLDWEAAKMYDSSGTDSIYWGSRTMNDSLGISSISWGSRVLFDDGGDARVDWINNFLYDSSTVVGLDWGNRQLRNSGGDALAAWGTNFALQPLAGAVTSHVTNKRSNKLTLSANIWDGAASQLKTFELYHYVTNTGGTTKYWLQLEDTTGANLITFGANGASAQLAKKLILDAGTASDYTDLTSDSTQKALVTKKGGLKAVLDRTLFTQTADATVADTVAETSILGTGVGGKSISDNTFAIGNTINFKVGGYQSSTGSPTLTIRLKLQGVTVATAVITMSNETNKGFSVEGSLTIRTIGATGTVQGSGYCNEFKTGSNNTVALLNLTTATVDTTAVAAFDITAQWSVANAGNTITSQTSQISFIN